MKHLTDANKDKLLSFLRSRAAAGEASLKSWGRDQRPQIPGLLAEEIADALVAEGKATRETKVHGGRVWRAAVEAPPAPTSDEPDVEGAAEEEPVAVAGAAEPCQRCAAAIEAQRDIEVQRGVLEDVLSAARARISELARERDEARRSLATSAAEYDRLLSHLRDRLAIEETASVEYIVGAVGLLVDGADARRRVPTLDPGAIAHYLLELPADRWQALATARQQLAEGRTLAERGTRLQTEALATVEGLLSAPAGEAPVEATEEPEPPPSGEQPASDEPDPASVIGRVLRWLRKRPDARARQVAEALSLSVPHANSALVNLHRRGLVERVELGLYRAVRAKEAA